MQRKLTVILAADVVGYAGLMERDEAGALARLKANRAAIFDPKVAAHGGRVFKLMGDGALVEFPSAVAAVACAHEIQQALAAEPDAPDRIRYRVGINLGEVIVEGDDIYGDGVNIAARLQALAEPGGVAVSQKVRDEVAGKVGMEFEDLGEHAVKSIERPIRVFALRERRAAAEKPGRASVCVLPFANLTRDPEKEYFSDGMAEELICTLARTPGLKVPARTSSFAYKGRNIDVRKIAADLGVGAVLEGSVRSAGERVRVTAQLIDAENGFHLWSQNYDRKFEDLFALQDELAGAIASALRVHLTPSGRPTQDLEAYQLYLRAQALSTRDDETAIRLLNEAIARDPGFSRAYAAKAYVLYYRLALDFGQTWIADEIEETTRRALALDPGLAAVKAISGATHSLHARWIEAHACFEAAIALDPDDPVTCQLHSLGFAAATGRYADALDTARTCYRLAPALIGASISLAGVLQFCGDDPGSLDQTRVAIELGHPPDMPPLPIFRSQAARRAGRMDEARDEILKLFPPDIRAAGADAAAARVYAALGDPSQTDAAVEALAALQRNPEASERLASWPLSVMCLHWHAMLGAMDHAYAIAERILQDFESTGTLNVVGHLPSLWMPELREFRRDPRFQDFVRRLNLFPYWRRYGPPDGCRLDGDTLVVP